MAQPEAPQALPVPQHVYQAQSQLTAALEQAEGKPVDLLKAPWGDVEKAVIKLLGGPFQPNRPEHQFLALGIAGALGARLAAEHQAFWFLNRDAPEGATLGFPDAIIMLSPFGMAMDALAQGKLAKLEDLAADIRRSLAQVRFGAGANPAAALGQQKLGPADYQRLFDPGFLQFVVLEPTKAKTALESRPDSLMRDLRDALGRTNPPLQKEAREQFEGQILMALQRMDPAKTLAEQVDRSLRIAELMAHVSATTGNTSAALQEFWVEIILPLLYIGAPQQFPPLDEEELEAYKNGAEPMALFVDVVPHAQPAPEDGVLGAFEPAEVGVVHPAFARASGLRMLEINSPRFKSLLEQFDAQKTADAVNRFTQYLAEKAGKPVQETPQGKEMLNAAMHLLTELKTLVTTTPGALCLRRITEMEAAFEGPLSLVRKAMQSGRIILAP
jgi:hypothetical protein